MVDTIGEGRATDERVAAYKEWGLLPLWICGIGRWSKHDGPDGHWSARSFVSH